MQYVGSLHVNNSIKITQSIGLQNFCHCEIGRERAYLFLNTYL